ncbi:Hypothetical_protein [Hexamita inflata]|uniref:Hypothetical_protein n=1 Tax=Hexamita inflata TaxID=28002 RepID=A0AA86Q125_9EUKA|nr:Hypothetical protein HINF_LOCUS36853 [Hexamita inflata]
MTLFPALNLEALRVAADTLVPRFIPAISKIVTKITSEVNNNKLRTKASSQYHFRVQLLFHSQNLLALQNNLLQVLFIFTLSQNTNFTSEVNNVSSSVEPTQVV